MASTWARSGLFYLGVIMVVSGDAADASQEQEQEEEKAIWELSDKKFFYKRLKLLFDAVNQADVGERACRLYLCILSQARSGLPSGCFEVPSFVDRMAVPAYCKELISSVVLPNNLGGGRVFEMLHVHDGMVRYALSDKVRYIGGDRFRKGAFARLSWRLKLRWREWVVLPWRRRYRGLFYRGLLFTALYVDGKRFAWKAFQWCVDRWGTFGFIA